MKMRTEIPAESVSGLPQTSLSQTIPVNAFDAKQYIATLEADVRIWSGMSSDTAKARAEISRQHLDMAKKLFGMDKTIGDKMAEAFYGKEVGNG